MDSIDTRQYQITAVLGEGGFGKVYQARMIMSGGFSKDVAIKLLRNNDVPAETLQRFRDEARILGLIRDRAVVHVDAPTRLGGRWAVVMELVGGASVRQLLELGPIPPGPAVEIIQEVARALGHVYAMPGPDGSPLNLLHRDIKPGNIQLTPSGEIKLLDFGVAKADFADREAHTSGHVGGTIGYIAPERLDGQEGPESDVFSLGVVLYEMVTGNRPSRREMMGLQGPPTEGLAPDTVLILKLSQRMRDPWPENRPTTSEIEDLCAQLRRRIDGQSLRRWAEETVPLAGENRPDELVGAVLTETLSLRKREGGDQARGGWGRALVFTGLVVMAVLLLLIGGISILGGLTYPAIQPTATDPAPIATPDAAPKAPSEGQVAPERAPPPPAPEARGVEPAEAKDPPTEPAAAAPSDEAPEATPSEELPEAPPEEAPIVPAQPPQVQPAPAAPAPRPPPAITRAVTFSSAPLGAEVYVDGRRIGQTPLLNIDLREGRRTIRMEANNESITRTITVGRRAPSRYVWMGGDRWEQHY